MAILYRVKIDSDYIPQEAFYYGNSFEPYTIKPRVAARTANGSLLVYEAQYTKQGFKVGGVAQGPLYFFDTLDLDSPHTFYSILPVQERFSVSSTPFSVDLADPYRSGTDSVSAVSYDPVVTDDLGGSCSYSTVDSDTLSITSVSLGASYVYVSYFPIYTVLILQPVERTVDEVHGTESWSVTLEEI